MPNRDELLAARLSEDEMRDYLGVASLRFVSIDGLYRAVGEPNGRDPNNPKYHDAVFTGDYPVEPKDMIALGFKMKTAAE